MPEPGADVAGGEAGIDGAAERIDAAPLLVGVGQGDARPLLHALDVHVVAELDLGVVDGAGDRRRVAGIGGAGERDVPLAGEQAGGRIEADPAGARQVDLGPGMQVGEVVVGAGGSVQGFFIGLQLYQVTGGKAGGESQVP